MTLYGFIFYILSIIILVATVMAITRRHPVHAIVYLTLSFLATGLLFYLLGAPFLALLEIIIYAGAIMILFLFMVMMLNLNPAEIPWGPALNQWVPAIVLGGITFVLAAVMLWSEPVGLAPLNTLAASPLALGRFLFEKYWFQVEIASFLLLAALVGTLYLGRLERKPDKARTKEGA
jgi:NADH-quinone oxidoreductase subunit J